MMWTEFVRPKPNRLYAGPWRSFSFGRDLRVNGPSTWVPGEKVSTKGIKEEGVESLLFLNLDRLLEAWSLRQGVKTLNGWDGADITATDPTGTVHIFELKYGASEEHVVDQALAYTVGLLRHDRTHWFDEQRLEERQIVLASRVAGFWLNQRADKWSRPDDRPQLEALRAALLENVGGSDVGAAYPVAAMMADALEAARGLEPSQERIAVDVPDSRPMGLHLHLVVPSPERMNPEQVDALAHLKFRGLQVSIWQVACRRPDAPTADARGDLAFREVWLRPLDTQRATERGDSLHPCDHVGPLLCDVALRQKRRPSRPWKLGRKNAARIGSEWHGESIPELRVMVTRGEEPESGHVVRVTMATVVPTRWASIPEAARSIEARERVATRWLLRVVPSPEAAPDAAALERLQTRAVSWTATDAVTGIRMKVWRSSGLVQAHVEWPYDPGHRKATADLLDRLIEAAKAVSAEHPDAFPSEPW